MAVVKSRYPKQHPISTEWVQQLKNLMDNPLSSNLSVGRNLDGYFGKPRPCGRLA
jgi:hypothetical protein